jgi:hypothetical protein
MSNALAISAVTGVLQSMLSQVYNHPASALGNVVVSATAPDIVQTIVGTGTNAPLQVNLFLHQVTHNPAWRNMGLPTLSSDGANGLNQSPLALDLHYMVTAYAAGDGQAEALLGNAILTLHLNQSLPRAQIRSALAALGPTYPASFASAVAASGLADQVEMLTITPSLLGKEEIAWLWTAPRVDYRPSYPFRVSVVLIQPNMPVTTALPVLQRSIAVQAGIVPAFPSITAVTAPNGQPAAVLGDTVTVTGSGLTGVSGLILSSLRLAVPQTLSPVAGGTDTSFEFIVPNPMLPTPQTNPSDLPAGVYTLTAQTPSTTVPVTVTASNSLPFAIAPHILPSWAPGTLTAGASVVVQVPCAPYLRPGQEVSLIIGSQQAPAEVFTSPTNTPSFLFTPLQATGQAVPVRLRVDGIDSPIVDMTRTPPVFMQPMVEVK